MPLTWSVEMEELQRAMRRLPDALKVEADQYAEAAAKGTALTVRQHYAQHWVTGTLMRGVTAEPYARVRGKDRVGWQARSRAPHAWLFEHTTRPRFYVTKPGSAGGGGGKLHPTGRMWKGSPPPETFVPTAMRFRRELYLNFKRMLAKAGFQVYGDA
jgi:hypothetical protein